MSKPLYTFLVSKGIMDAHGGVLSVYSAGEGKGSEFTIELPIKETCANLPNNVSYDSDESKNNSWDRMHSGVLRRVYNLAFVGKVTPEVQYHSKLRSNTGIRHQSVRTEGEVTRRQVSSQRHPATRSGTMIMYKNAEGNSDNKVEIIEEKENDENNKTYMPFVQKSNLSARRLSNNGTSTRRLSTNRRLSNNELSTRKLSYNGIFSAISSASNSFGSFSCSELNENSLTGVDPMSFSALSLQSARVRANMTLESPIERGMYSFKEIDNPVKSTGEECRSEWKRKKVLIVDDVPVNRKMLRRVLESRFDIVEEAGDGQEAVDLVRSAQRKGGEALYDVVTMDYQMPVMDGATACRIIRQLGYDGAIVAVTGNAYPADIQSLITNGANRVFLKPLNIKEFDAFLSTI